MSKSAATLIAAQTRIGGALFSQDDVVIEGTIDGAVLGEASVTIGANAQIAGEVRGRDVVVAGKLDHPIFASGTVRLLATAEVRGNIEAVRVAMDEGALFEGQMKMVRSGQTTPVLRGPSATATPTPTITELPREIPSLPEIGRSRLIRKAT